MARPRVAVAPSLGRAVPRGRTSARAGAARLAARLAAQLLPSLLLLQSFAHPRGGGTAGKATAFSFVPSSTSPRAVLGLSRRRGRVSPLRRPSQRSPNDGTEGPVYDRIPSEFERLFDAASLATLPRSAENTAMGHDPFRFEWGTWANETSLEDLMDRVDEVRMKGGAYDALTSGFEEEEEDDDGGSSRAEALRYRIGGGRDWDAILHVLPQGTEWTGRWPTGSWAIVKCLLGMAEISMLRGPDRNGMYSKAAKKDLRGGSDGSFGGGSSVGGADCVKYVGGPMRSYGGKSGKTTLLEVVVRPPISSDDDEMQIMEDLDDLGGTLAVVVPPAPEEVEESAEAKRTAEEKDKEREEEEEENDDHPVEKADNDDDGGKVRSLASKIGTEFTNVGGLDDQLDDIARRVLASRANPSAARRLGVSHVRGVLLSGPPGCGKTLLARELASILGAREPQIVNGPEILDKYIGEAERRVRELFAPAELEHAQVGDDSALHIIILDEMDAIARKRGTMTADTTGVRDSVVNQLLAKMDGVREASNVLVVGLTNRPELLDPALLRPGRLEVQLRVELPDLRGRRDILRIHTRRMKKAGGLSDDASALLEDLGEKGIAARAEHFSGAELAGLVRSAASFALARAMDDDDDDGKTGGGDGGVVGVADLNRALREVRPALGKQDEVLRQRFPLGISDCSSSMKRVMRDLRRFTAPVTPRGDEMTSAPPPPPRVQSLLLVGAGGNGGAGSTALAAWAASRASSAGSTDYARFITALDLLAGEGGGGDEARAAALVDKFSEAREMSNSLLVLDDVDTLCAGSGPGGYSSVMLATLRALLRSPPPSSAAAKAGGQSRRNTGRRGSGTGKTLHVLAATSRSDAACVTLHELFDETIVVPLLSDADSVEKLLSDSLRPRPVADPRAMARLIVDRLGGVGCKTALRLAERALAASARGTEGDDDGQAQLAALAEILDDLAGDEATAEKLCEVIY